jgi:hypothetical protein
MTRASKEARPRAPTVYCMCGWRGRRKTRECACYDENAMYCSCMLGLCPKCRGRLCRTSPAQDAREFAQAEAWCASEEGRAAIASLTGAST